MAAIKRLFGAFRSSRESSKKSESESRSSIEWVVAGLGNPGDEYARSRHNAGFMTVGRRVQPPQIQGPHRGGLAGRQIRIVGQAADFLQFERRMRCRFARLLQDSAGAFNSGPR